MLYDTAPGCRKIKIKIKCSKIPLFSDIFKPFSAVAAPVHLLAPHGGGADPDAALSVEGLIDQQNFH